MILQVVVGGVLRNIVSEQVLILQSAYLLTQELGASLEACECEVSHMPQTAPRLKTM